MPPTSTSTSMYGRSTPVNFTPCPPAMDAQLLKILDFQDAKAYVWCRRFSSGELSHQGQSYKS